ncbi:nitrate reductase molybdenum cofactor assembly chaperone [Sulfolobus tengchongensis]|uniref:Nitrate reductase molybdenum cofactor assembly chaperone n=1 Tax=Sulfolobus tengchongensis TaxID=207809 RepID=A0AAX4KXE3_9CREN
MNLLEITAELLEYPTSWIGRRKEIINSISQISSPHKQFLLEFLESISVYNELDLEEIYVSTFDNNDYITLYITYYITGEEKERIKPAKRGLLLAWLKERIKMNGKELPDYLPVLLKYLSANNDDEVKKILQRPISIILNRLKEKNSIFYPLIKLAYLELYGGNQNE